MIYVSVRPSNLLFRSRHILDRDKIPWAALDMLKTVNSCTTFFRGCLGDFVFAKYILSFFFRRSSFHSEAADADIITAAGQQESERTTVATWCQLETLYEERLPQKVRKP